MLETSRKITKIICCKCGIYQEMFFKNREIELKYLKFELKSDVRDA